MNKINRIPGVLGLNPKQEQEVIAFYNFCVEHQEALEAHDAETTYEAVALIPGWFWNYGTGGSVPCTRSDLRKWTGIKVYPGETDSFGWLTGCVDIVDTRIGLLI